MLLILEFLSRKTTCLRTNKNHEGRAENISNTKKKKKNVKINFS